MARLHSSNLKLLMSSRKNLCATIMAVCSVEKRICKHLAYKQWRSKSKALFERNIELDRCAVRIKFIAARVVLTIKYSPQLNTAMGINGGMILQLSLFSLIFGDNPTLAIVSLKK